MRGKVTALAVAAAMMLIASPADASSPSVDQRLVAATTARDAKLAKVQELRARLATLQESYARIESLAGRAALALVTTSQAEQAAEQAVAVAQQQLDERIRAAFEVGYGTTIQAMLSADHLADLPTIQEYAARTLSVDQTVIAAGRVAETALAALRAEAAGARATLAPTQRRLAALLAEMRATLAEAQRVAELANMDVAQLEAERQALADAAARQVGRNALAAGVTGRDQSGLLALLGPTGGMTCDTPEGLRETGKSFTGYASWYGWDFAGQSTANGAVFDPTLFTAANRWLPFGTFLRIRYRDKCAIVLVNDRGPYGHLERVIDLSMASANYLGVGVSWVTADILVPKEILG